MASPTKFIALNRKARFEYELERTLEAGIELEGGEVKSIKAGEISLNESFVTIKDGEVWLTNAHVKPYQPAQGFEQDPTRPRKLLLKKAEISKLVGENKAHRRTMVPTKVYLKNGRVKVEIAVARGKQQHDKRASVKKREQEREAQAAMKQARNS
ncbi:SsrA-binding protein SmpB [Patescibacteria group bacterium]|nr:SsrA-binding protein SmpB [Patescibacteria group bacterium]